MLIILTIFLIILLIQILLALYSWGLRGVLKNKYAFPLSERYDLSNTIEKFREKYNKKENLRITITEQLDAPAFAEENHILINKKNVYDTTLYPNFYLIFQAELTKRKYYNLRILNNIQNILFLVQIIFLFLALIINSGNIADNEIIMLGAFLIQILILIISLVGFFAFGSLLNNVYKMSIELLNLDEVETARALGLKDELAYFAFEYPFEAFWRILNFFR